MQMNLKKTGSIIFGRQDRCSISPCLHDQCGTSIFLIFLDGRKLLLRVAASLSATLTILKGRNLSMPAESDGLGSLDRALMSRRLRPITADIAAREADQEENAT